jgi:hypothetical protein
MSGKKCTTLKQRGEISSLRSFHWLGENFPRIVDLKRFLVAVDVWKSFATVRFIISIGKFQVTFALTSYVVGEERASSILFHCIVSILWVLIVFWFGYLKGSRLYTGDGLRGGLISLWLYKENNKLQDWKNVFTLHIPPWAPHTYVFVVLTSLTHPRKNLLVVLKIGKAKEWSAPLCMFDYLCVLFVGDDVELWPGHIVLWHVTLERNTEKAGKVNNTKVYLTILPVEFWTDVTLAYFQIAYIWQQLESKEACVAIFHTFFFFALTSLILPSRFYR